MNAWKPSDAWERGVVHPMRLNGKCVLREDGRVCQVALSDMNLLEMHTSHYRMVCGDMAETKWFRGKPYRPKIVVDAHFAARPRSL